MGSFKTNGKYLQIKGEAVGLGEEDTTEPIVDSDYLIEEFLGISRILLCSHIKTSFHSSCPEFYEERKPFFHKAQILENREILEIIYHLGNPFSEVSESEKENTHQIIRSLTDALSRYLNRGLAFSLVLTEK